MMTLIAAALCGFANWVRGGLFGETIKAAARAVHAWVEIAWRSVGDRLLTTPLALAAVALLAGAAWWQALAAWLLLYVAFIPGWVWIGMGRLPGSGQSWSETRKNRPQGVPGAQIRFLVELAMGSPSSDAVTRPAELRQPDEPTIEIRDRWSFARRWAYDALALALRGLVVTLPAGAALGLPLWAFAGAAMPLCYEIGQHMPGRWRGTGAAEALFGAWLGASLVLEVG